MTTDLFEKNFLRVPEIANYLGMSDGAVYHWVHKGELPSIKVGGTVLVPAPAFRAFMERGRSEVTPLPQRLEQSARFRRSENLDDQVHAFESEVGSSVAEYLAAWHTDQIEDTPENARNAALAMGLQLAINEEAAGAHQAQPA